MKAPKISATIIFSIFLFVAVFYFCSTQSNYEEVNYTKIHSKAVQKLSNKDTLRVMTYNIGYLSGMTNNKAVDRPEGFINKNLQKSVQLFKSINPDIVGFQEIDFESSRTFNINQYLALLELDIFNSGAMAVNWDKKYVPFPYWPFRHHFGNMYSGQAVLSKFKILENDRIVLPQPESNPFYYNDFYLDRLAQISWLEVSNIKLLLINVHFEAWDGPTREKQAAIVLELYRKYANDFPVILMGDFNCTPPFAQNAFEENTIRSILNEKGLEICLNESNYKAHPNDYFTFNSENPSSKIDYIFYNSKFFHCLESHVVHEANDISDHLPVMATLIFKSDSIIINQVNNR
jgi:endonuclease/exonuclease/phosphatase family metal-dependent hydrolase